MENAREFQKNIYFCFTAYAKAFDCVDHNKPWKILKEMGIPDHVTCLLRNLYAGQEAKNQTWNNRLVQNWEKSREGSEFSEKSRDITLLLTVHLVEAVVLPVVMYGCWIMKTER